VEKVSIDEAFLDITGTIHLYGDALSLGNSLRCEIRKACGVTCSVGIASNRLMAKIGSELNKPDGITVVPTGEREVAEFLRNRPVSILWGIGRHTEAMLKPYGIATCGDIQRLPVDQLAAILGSRREAETLRGHAFGVSDDSVHWEPASEKSVSREHTFKEDVTDRRVIRDTMLRLVADVGRRFRESPRWARTARIKLRDSDFNTITRQAPFDAPARDDFAFRAKALGLLERERTGAVRLIGFGVTNIQNSPDESASLFPGDDDVRRGKRERLSEALDVLRNHGIVV
jgi:nucleotidyltransferase/DNA polymerase involved in DNA repair